MLLRREDEEMLLPPTTDPAALDQALTWGVDPREMRRDNQVVTRGDNSLNQPPSPVSGVGQNYNREGWTPLASAVRGMGDLAATTAQEAWKWQTDPAGQAQRAKGGLTWLGDEIGKVPQGIGTTYAYGPTSTDSNAYQDQAGEAVKTALNTIGGRLPFAIAGKAGEAVLGSGGGKAIQPAVDAAVASPAVGRSKIAQVISKAQHEAILNGAPRSFVDLSKAKVNAGVNARPDLSVQTVRDPARMMYPRIYGNPKEIAERAAGNLVEEDPIMRQLWGVGRGELDEIARTRGQGNLSSGILMPANPTGSVAAQQIMTPANEQRLVDILTEGGKYPGLKHADAWYVMDPVYHRMTDMFGKDEGHRRYKHLITMTGMASPGSNVLTEIQRGTGAHWLNEQGRFADFIKYAGLPEKLAKNAKPGAMSRELMGAEFPPDMRYMAGHSYHKTSQGDPMASYLERGYHESNAPKVPLYVRASGTPETGWQWHSPVGDAHWSRGVGLADVRGGAKDLGKSFSRSEYDTLSPWWREQVAGKAGLTAVPAQARLWTILGPQTGVDSPLGQGKLELFSIQIKKAADRLGISPEKARDLILSGGAGAGMLGAMGVMPQGISNPAAMGSLAEQGAM